jgi:SAM-dependent methyltransferase
MAGPESRTIPETGRWVIGMSLENGGTYIHGSSAPERERLALMNDLINDDCLEALDLSDEELVLDLGAGTGIFTRRMAAVLPAAARIVGIERDPAQLEAACAAQPEANAACIVEYRQGDAAGPPLEAGEWGQFDLAHARFLLEHVAEPLAVVRQMVDAVRPGGRIVLLDDDHELMRLWPEPPGVQRAWQAFYSAFAGLGLDPCVGRKLPSLLSRAGARATRIQYVFYGACAGEERFEDIVENLASVLAGARDTVLAAGAISDGDYDQAVTNLRAYKQAEDASVWYVINWAEGRKP